MLLQIIWFLCGVLAAAIQMFSFRKDWWETFQEDFFKTITVLPNLIISILTIFGGPFSLATVLIMNKITKIKTAIYFKIPKNQ